MTDQTTVHLQESLEVKKDVELLWISNLRSATTGQEIVNFFENYVGPVKCFTMHYNSRGSYSCQAGISFCKSDDARKALFYDRTLLDGRPMNLKLFVNGKRVFKDQIVFPGPIVSTLLPVFPENVPSLDFVKDFKSDGDLHQFSSEEKQMLQPQQPVILSKSSVVAQEFHHDPPQFDGVDEEYLLVSNLEYSATEKQILDYFEKWIGPVMSVGMHLDDKGFLNGKATIVFRRPDDARKALLLGKQRLNGRQLILKLFVNGKRIRANSIFNPNSTCQPSDNWISCVPFVSLPSLNSIAEYFPDDPILDTTFTIPSKLDTGIDHPQGPSVPPFLPFVFVKDCVRPYKPSNCGFN